MALWSSGVLWSDGALWGPGAPPPPLFSYTQPNTQHTKMKRKFYYPNKVAEQPAWHFNYADQVLAQGEDIGLVLADLTATANDSRHVGYAIGAWLNGARDFATAATGQVEVLKYGTGVTPFDLPVFMPPAPPAGLTAVLPGALARIFRFVKMIKGAPGYTEGIGLLMGVVGSELPPPPPPGSGPTPRLTLSLSQTPALQEVVVRFFKDGHEGIWLESRRNGGVWEFMIISTKSPYSDARPLLVPGQAEVREYRAMFWDAGQPNGDWCDVAKITVSP